MVFGQEKIRGLLSKFAKHKSNFGLISDHKELVAASKMAKGVERALIFFA